MQLCQGGLTYPCGFYACPFYRVGHARASSCGTGKSIVPTSFLCRQSSSNNILKAESGDKEAGKIWYDKKILSIIAVGYQS